MYVCACPKLGACSSVVSLVYVLHFVYRSFFYMNKAVSFSRLNCFTWSSWGLLKLTVRYGLCSLLKAVRWPRVVNFCVILVSCGELSHWQSYHIFFFYIYTISIEKCQVEYENHLLIIPYRNSQIQSFVLERIQGFVKCTLVLFEFFRLKIQFRLINVLVVCTKLYRGFYS